MLAILPLSLTGCWEDDNYDICPDQAEKIQLTLTLPEQTRIATNTRATSSRFDYSIVNNINLVLVDKSNKIERVYYFDEKGMTPNDGNVSMTSSSLPIKPEEGDNQRFITIVGNKGDFENIACIYTVANYGKAIENTITTLEQLTHLKQTASDGQPNKKDNCMMFGSTTQLSNGTISLKRTLAMFSVKMDGTNLKEGVRITPTKISLHNVPTSCFIGIDNKINSKNESVATGQVVDVTNADGWGALTRGNTVGGHEQETGTIPMFMFENLQGTNDKITSIDQQITKHPKDFTGDIKNPSALQSFLDDGRKYTYIQIEADYYYKNPRSNDGEIKGSITYRFLLGDNEYNDFNLRKNTYYQITLNLKGNGGANEDGKEDANGNLIVNSDDLSWRVDMNIRDWGFVKDKFDFDCHTVITKMDIVGSGWKIKDAKDEKGNSIAGWSWVKFNTSKAGTTGWSEPTPAFDIGVNGEIYCYIEPIQEYEFNNVKQMPTKRVATLTLERAVNGTTESQTVTITQWYPIKIPMTINGKTINVFMERFEEESRLPWGCNDVDLSNKITLNVPSNTSPSKFYNFGDLTSTYLAGNAFFVWTKEGYGSSWNFNTDLGMAASAYCLNKSFQAGSGGTGNMQRYYTQPSASILQELIKYSESHADGTFEPLHIDDDYWTSTVYSVTPKETSYWDGSSQTIKSTSQRNELKRVRTIYMDFGQDDNDLFP